MKNLWKNKSAEKVSMRLLYCMIGATAIIFLLFWMVGYDRPFEEDPNYNAPLFTDAILGLMLVMTVGAAGAGLWAMWRSLKISGKGGTTVNNIHVKKIGYAVTGGLIGVLLLTFLLGSPSPMEINGISYTDAFWLRASDMFINTIIVLIVAAAVAVMIGATTYYRRRP